VSHVIKGAIELTNVVHAKELRSGKNDACVPRKNRYGHEDEVEEDGGENEDGDASVSL
jgi:hypothetical protein